MKRRYLFIVLIVSFIIELFLSFNFIKTNESYTNDPVKTNELVKNIENNNKPNTDFEYTLFDSNENIIYQTNNNLSKNLVDAYKKEILLLM